MKITFLVLAVIILAITAKAQPNKVVSAFNYIGYGEFDKAKEYIDPTITHPKTMDKAKTWWYRGIIYQNLYTMTKYRELAPEGYKVAYDSYIKALVLNFKDPQYQSLNIETSVDDRLKFFELLQDDKTQYENSAAMADIMAKQLPNLKIIYLSIGIDNYQAKSYDKALDMFETALTIGDITSVLRPVVDTSLFFNAALSAEKANNYEKCIKYYKKVINYGYGSSDEDKASIYCQYANVYMAQNDTVKYLETLEKARKAYPDESLILITQMNFYISTGQASKGKDLIKIAIEKDPTNKLLHFNYGTILEGDGELEEAEKSYYRALEIDSMYFDPAYNIGAMYINKANDLKTTANQLDLKDPKYPKLKKEYEEMFMSALPKLERAYNINKTDLVTVKTLATLYYNLGKLDKFEELDKLYKELKDAQKE